MTRSFDAVAAKVAESWDADTRAAYEAASAYFAAQAHAHLALGEQVAAVRREHGLSQTGLADAAGVPQPEISRIERGSGNPTRDTLNRLAGALGSRLALVPDDAPGRRPAS